MTSNATHHLPVCINCGVTEGSRTVESHCHPSTELFYVVGGECRVGSSESIVHARPGQLFVWPAGMSHYASPRLEVKLYYLTFESDPLLFDDTYRMIDLGNDRWVEAWFAQLCDIKDSICEGVSELTDGVLYVLLQRIRQIEERKNGRKNMHPAVVRALRLIEKDIAAPLDVKELSNQAMVSPSYFTALFREHLGIGPMKYIQQLRMNFAKQQLRDPYLTVQEISYRCGYEDPNYFARLFRKFHEISPSRFRSQYLKAG